jgi:hypothetical protein
MSYQTAALKSRRFLFGGGKIDLEQSIKGFHAVYVQSRRDARNSYAHFFAIFSRLAFSSSSGYITM